MYGAENASTVAELIELLKTLPQEAKIITTWEGTDHALRDFTYYIDKQLVVVEAEHSDYQKTFTITRV